MKWMLLTLSFMGWRRIAMKLNKCTGCTCLMGNSPLISVKCGTTFQMANGRLPRVACRISQSILGPHRCGHLWKPMWVYFTRTAPPSCQRAALTLFPKKWRIYVTVKRQQLFHAVIMHFSQSPNYPKDYLASVAGTCHTVFEDSNHRQCAD